MGINSRSSLHPDWINYFVRTIDGFKTATVSIVRRANPTSHLVYDYDTKTYSGGTFSSIYEGIARIQPYGINLDLEVGNDPTARRLVLVQLHGKNLGINNDDILTITASDNPDLLLYRFDIRGSIGSSLEWGTNLVCEANLKKTV